MIPIMSGVAGVVDYSDTSMGASKLQESLDATAFAIATKYKSGMTPTDVQDFGSDFFAANINRKGIIFGSAEQLSGGAGFSVSDTAVDFVAEAQATSGSVDVVVGAKLTHAGFIAGPTTWQAPRKAHVRFLPGQPACVLALDEGASDSVKIQGSTQVRLQGCVVASNSNALDSISRGGSAQLTAKCVSTVGETTGLSSAKLACGSPLERQYPSLDPLAGVVPPAYTACKSMPGGKTKSLTPGTYCNKTWSGDVTLDPGIYIMRGGQIKLGGGGHLTGHGVTIFLTEGAEFTTNANDTVDLTAPTGGDYAGIVIYQEKADTNQLTINGTADSNVQGFIYAPGAHIFYAGNSTMSGSGDCIRLVGNTIEMTGNSDLAANCEAELGGRKMDAGRVILLIQ